MTTITKRLRVATISITISVAVFMSAVLPALAEAMPYGKG